MVIEHPPIGFQLESFFSSPSDSTFLVFGKKLGDNKLLLPWLQFSIWPVNTNDPSFNRNLPTVSKSFLQDIINFEHASKKGDEFIVSLLIDKMHKGENLLPVIGFIEAFADNSLTNHESRDILHYSLVNVLISHGITDKTTVEHVARLYPRLPPSLVLSYFEMVVESDIEDISEIAVSRANALLSARRMVARRSIQSASDLNSAIEKHLPKLQILDAERALSFLDSKIPLIREEGSKALHAVLIANNNQTPSKNKGIKDRSYWEDQIKMKREQVQNKATRNPSAKSRIDSD